MVNGKAFAANIMQHGDSCIVNFWRENKNRTNRCAQPSKGIPRKTANLLLLTLYILLKLTCFPCK